jgi:hypothetical protein
MFAVHDFTYESLNFRENMFGVHDFPQKDLEFRSNPPKTPLSMNFYVWASELLKKLQPINFQKQYLKLRHNLPIDPSLFFKKRLQLPTIKQNTQT